VTHEVPAGRVLLADRTADTLAAGQSLTVPELARALRVRDADVRATLRGDVRFERGSAPAGRSRQARAWRLVPTTAAKELVPRAANSSRSVAGMSRAPMPAGTPERVEVGWWRLAPGPKSPREAVAAARAGNEAAA